MTREDEDDHGKDQRQRRAVAELQVGERVEIDEEDRGRRLVLRLPGGHDVELVEGEQRADHRDQRHQQDRPQRQRQRDAPDALPVLAPSTIAASLISSGMAWMAATKRIMPKPMTFQTTETMIAQFDVSASTPSQRIGFAMMPRSISSVLMRP